MKPSQLTLLSSVLYACSNIALPWAGIFILFALVPWILDLNQRKKISEVLWQTLWMQIAMGLVTFDWVPTSAPQVWNQSQFAVFLVYLILGPLAMSFLLIYSSVRYFLREIFHPLWVAIVGGLVLALSWEYFHFLAVSNANHLFRIPDLLAFAKIGGAHFVSFLLVLSSEIAALLYARFSKNHILGRLFLTAAPVAFFVLVSVVYSRYSEQEFSETIPIVIAQTLSEVAPTARDTDTFIRDTIKNEQKKFSLLFQGKDLQPDSRIFILPEGAVSFLHFFREAPNLKEYHDHFESEVNRLNAPLFFGAYRRMKDFTSNEFVVIEPSVDGMKTAAFQKRKLMPFGESLPTWLNTFPGVRKFFRISELAPGSPAPIFGELGEYRWGGVICNEIFYQEYAREYVEAGAQFLITIGYERYLQGAGGHDHLLAAAVLRSIENAVPIFKSADYGGTVVIDMNGRILEEMERGVQGFIAIKAPVGDARGTFYTKNPNTLYYLAAGIFVLTLLGLARFFRRNGVGKLFTTLQ